MQDKYKNKYRTTPARLTGWDYGSHGLYFITICTKDRVRYFGEITVETQKSDGLLMSTGYRYQHTFLLLNWTNL